jgi:hypothetical protein
MNDHSAGVERKGLDHRLKGFRASGCRLQISGFRLQAFFLNPEASSA